MFVSYMELFQDKDAKISFLQKAIDVVIMVSGEPLAAKPARIVAGHEPERTNELLQLIGKCCLNKVGRSPPFEALLGGTCLGLAELLWDAFLWSRCMGVQGCC